MPLATYPHPELLRSYPKVILMAIEMCVVFKKDVVLAKAELILESLAYPYRQGGDSSRGRLYGDNTGPKFIVTVSRAELENFISDIGKQADVYEAYEANWEMSKD
jgi:hypothetical protein